jgi:redox-sensitive bicupin YhaK (pirin superfamily)
MKSLQFTVPSPDLHWVGNGFPVRSIFSYSDLGKELDPFLLLDYAEPYFFEPGSEKRGVGAHPHRGFETVTFAFQGEVEHRDSTGGGGRIGPGDVQWMTAGAGLLHEEFHSEDFTRKGGNFQMVQLWVNLPAKNKDAPPRYQSIQKDEIPTVELPDDAGKVSVVAGEFQETAGPAKTFTPINLWNLHLKEGKAVTLPLPPGHTAALLVMSGQITANETTLRPGDLAVFEREGSELHFEINEPAQVLFLGGEPLEEPIVGQGPFVMNSRDEIVAAFRDFEAGRMGELR